MAATASKKIRLQIEKKERKIEGMCERTAMPCMQNMKELVAFWVREREKKIVCAKKKEKKVLCSTCTFFAIVI